MLAHYGIIYELPLRQMNNIFTKLNNILFLWGICFAINSIAFLFIYYKIHPTDRTLALHYNVLVGVDSYGRGKNLYYIPITAFVMSVVNFIFYKALKDTKSFLAMASVLCSIFLQIVLLVAVLFLSKID